MNKFEFTDEELLELLWIFDNLVLSAANSRLTDSGKIVSASVAILSPNVLLGIYKKFNGFTSEATFNNIVSKLEGLINGK